MKLDVEAEKMRDEIKSKYAKSFGTNLSQALNDNGNYKTTKQFAEEMKVSQNSMGSYLNGDMLPTLVTAIQIADKLGVSLDELLGRNNALAPISSSSTYGDIAKILIVLMDAGIIEIKAFNKEVNAYLANKLGPRDFDIYIHDDIINKFFRTYFALCQQQVGQDQIVRDTCNEMFEKELLDLNNIPINLSNRK